MAPHLLVPTDGTAPSLLAARLAALFAGPEGTLTFLHVATEVDVTALAGLDAISAGVGGVPSEFASLRTIEIEQEAAKILTNTRAVIGPVKEVHTIGATGRPADVILAHLERPEYEGAMVGSRGRGLLSRALLGSVSDAVVRHAEKPVVIARRDAIRSILVCLDGSEPSKRAAYLAADTARRLKARVALLHAVEFPVDTYLAERPAIEAALKANAEPFFAHARALLTQPPVSEEVVFHEPAHAIITTAERGDFDLIFVGRRGRTASTRTLLGSVSLRVAMNAPTSVIVVP